MPKYDLEEIIQKMQKDYAKYGSLADTLAKLDPLSERYKQTQTAALKMVQRQKNYAEYGGLADTLSQLNPLSDFFKKMESIALQINDSWMKHQSITMKSMREIHDLPALKMICEMQELQINSSKRYFDLVEESIHISDEIIDASHSHQIKQLNGQSLFINTLFLSIYILAIHAEVPLDQLIVTLAQSFLNSTLFYCLQSKYEATKTSTNYIIKNEFKNSRITIKNSCLYINPNLKSEIIEQLEQYKFLEIIQDPDLPKSWLKVRTEINKEILEGYILRSYTSPIK